MPRTKAERAHPPLDCAVIGAGPAGLTAATYLARFRRNVRVFDDGQSRARYIPVSHNCPGFPFGVSGIDLLGKMREQALCYGADLVDTRVDRLERADGGFVIGAGATTCVARTVLLASGIRDRLPALAQIERGIDDAVVRICAICDGYEARDDRIAVYGPAATVLQHACFLRTFSRRVTAVLSAPGLPDAAASLRARELGVRLLAVPEHIDLTQDSAQRIVACRIIWSEREEIFDTLYPVLGAEPKATLARALGARCDGNDELLVDAHMQTSIDGLYAAGDVVSALNQISVATGQAAVAATAIHNRLPNNAVQTG